MQIPCYLYPNFRLVGYQPFSLANITLPIIAKPRHIHAQHVSHTSYLCLCVMLFNGLFNHINSYHIRRSRSRSISCRYSMSVISLRISSFVHVSPCINKKTSAIINGSLVHFVELILSFGVLNTGPNDQLRPYYLAPVPLICANHQQPSK